MMMMMMMMIMIMNAHSTPQAMIHQLQAEMNFEPENEQEELLKNGINSIIRQLGEEHPENAKFLPKLANVEINELLFTACRRGATVSAWWLWKEGGSFSRICSDGMTPLHAAMKEEHFQTAEAVVLHMGGNMFLPDGTDHLLVDRFPPEMKDKLLKVC